MSKLWAERLTAVAMIAFAVIFLVQSIGLPSTSGKFPQFTEVAVILLALVMIVRSYVTHDDRFMGNVRWNFSYTGLKPVFVMAMAIAYGFAIFSVGFYVSSIVFYFVVTYMTGIRNYTVMVAVAVVLFPLMYLFFNVALGADLPKGLLF